MVAGTITNVLHDLPQLSVSVWLMTHPLQGTHQPDESICNRNCVVLSAAGMTLCSMIALLYSVFNRLSAALLLQATHDHVDDGRAEGGVDTLMLEYMAALSLHARSNWHNRRTTSRPHADSLLGSHEPTHEADATDGGLPQLIVPLVTDEIFQAQSATCDGTEHRRSGQYEKRPVATAAEMMLLHPIGDNQIPSATVHAHEQILRRDLDLYDKSDFASTVTPASTTVSGVVSAILEHCVADEAGRLVFAGQHGKWDRYDAAAEYVLAQLPNHIRSKLCLSNAKVRTRSVATPDELGKYAGASAVEDGSAVFLQSLLLQHPNQSESERTSDQTQRHGTALSGFSTATKHSTSASRTDVSPEKASVTGSTSTDSSSSSTQFAGTRTRSDRIRHTASVYNYNNHKFAAV
jgi:hypothetical protein